MILGWLVGMTFGLVVVLAVFVSAVGWHGNVSDWYVIPTIAWGVICGLAGVTLGGRR